MFVVICMPHCHLALSCPSAATHSGSNNEQVLVFVQYVPPSSSVSKLSTRIGIMQVSN